VEFARKFQQWEPQNALGYLMEGEYLHNRDSKVKWDVMDERAKQTEWRAVMEKAFAAPRYYTYLPERFLLERAQLRAHHGDPPIRLMVWAVSAPLPNLLNIRQYQQLLNKLGKGAETANH